MIQLQPQQLVSRWLFVGYALEGDLPDDVFRVTSSAWLREHGIAGIRFQILERDRYGATHEEMWAVQSISYIARFGSHLETYRRLDDRLREALRSDHFARLSPKLMFQPQCLMCGKALTDPASVARWIGPECYGSGTLDAGLFEFLGGVPERVVEGFGASGGSGSKWWK